MSDQIINVLIVGNQLAIQSTNGIETNHAVIGDVPTVNILNAVVDYVTPLDEGASLIVTSMADILVLDEEFQDDTIKCVLSRDWGSSTKEYTVFHQS